MQKLLHIGNAKFIKIQGLRLFLIWYQILNKNRTQVEELMFQKLIHGFDVLFYSNILSLDTLNAEVQKVFSNEQNLNNNLGINNNLNSNNQSIMSQIGRSIYSFEITPIIQSNDNNNQLTSQASSADQQQQQINNDMNDLNLTGSNILNSSGVSMSTSITSTASSALTNASLNNPNFTNSSLSSASNNNMFSLTAELIRNMLEFMQQDVSIFCFMKIY
jgi:hypothetical protein